MTDHATLIIDIQSYWHPGTGRGLGSRLDAVTHRDGRKLPVLPGRTLKGLLRDAVNRYEAFGGYKETVGEETVPVVEQLFGPYGEEGVHTWPGLLRFSDATLPAAEADYLAHHPELAAGLYRAHHATAVDHVSGTADNKSLRGIELVVPLTLRARIERVEGAEHRGLEGRWAELLDRALPLVRSVGAHRSRGLGRAVLSLGETK